MIEISEIEKRIGENHVLKNLSFTVKENRITGFLGINGSGKTTTFRIISGLMKPNDGSIIVDGISTLSNRQVVIEKCGFLFGNDPGLYNRLTAYENIMFFASLCDIPLKEAKKTIQDYANALNFESYLKTPAYALSKGTRQKVALVRSLIHSPKYIFLDEPTSGFDINAIEQTHELLLILKKNGHTIILASHILSEVEKLCDEIVILHNGKAVVEESLSSIEKMHGNLELVYRNIRNSNDFIT